MAQSPIRLGGGDQHAIEVMALGIEWATPLTDEQLARLVQVYNEHPEIRDFLPGKKHLQSLSIRMEGAETQLSTSPKSTLVDFTRSEPDGKLSWVLSLRPDFISCNASAYVGWKAAKPQLMKLLVPFVEVAALLGATIKAVGLQYLDSFRWPLLEGTRIEEILSRQSTWIPSRCFVQPSLWHVHQGWFSEASRGRRALNNLNIDLQHEDGEAKLFTLKIHGQHSLQALSAGVPAQLNIHLDEVSAIADELHQLNKKTLAELLTPSIIQRIGLNVAPTNVH